MTVVRRGREVMGCDDNRCNARQGGGGNVPMLEFNNLRFSK